MNKGAEVSEQLQTRAVPAVSPRGVRQNSRRRHDEKSHGRAIRFRVLRHALPEHSG